MYQPTLLSDRLPTKYDMCFAVRTALGGPSWRVTAEHNSMETCGPTCKIPIT